MNTKQLEFSLGHNITVKTEKGSNVNLHTSCTNRQVSTREKESDFRKCVRSLHNLYSTSRTCEEIRLLKLDLSHKCGRLAGEHVVDFMSSLAC